MLIARESDNPRPVTLFVECSTGPVLRQLYPVQLPITYDGNPIVAAVLNILHGQRLGDVVPDGVCACMVIAVAIVLNIPLFVTISTRTVVKETHRNCLQLSLWYPYAIGNTFN